MKPPQRQTGQGIWFIDLLLFCKIQVDLVSDPVNILYFEKAAAKEYMFLSVIIPGLSEPPVRTLRATIPENESHIFR